LKGRADDFRTDRRCLGEFDGRRPFGRAGDDVDLVGAILLDRGRNLAQPVDDLALDLFDHADVAEVDLPDVNGPKLVAPLM